MARTNASDVLEILDNCTLSTTIVDVYITAANLLVTEILGDDGDIGTMITEIEKWFAAHMIASTRWRTTEAEELGDAKIKYTGKTGFGLDFTPYGQMVKQLDFTGKMSRVDKKGAGIYAVKSAD